MLRPVGHPSNFRSHPCCRVVEDLDSTHGEVCAISGVLAKANMQQRLSRRGITFIMQKLCERGYWAAHTSIKVFWLAHAMMQPDLVMFNCAMKACDVAQDWRSAKQVLKAMVKRGLCGDAITFTGAFYRLLDALHQASSSALQCDQGMANSSQRCVHPA